MSVSVPPKTDALQHRLKVLQIVWAAIAASLLLPVGIARLLRGHPGDAPADPLVLANIAYGLGIALIAAALYLRQLRQRPAPVLGLPRRIAHPDVSLGRYSQLTLASAALAESVAWLGFVAWLVGNNERTFYTLLAMAAVALWLVRPRAEEWAELRSRVSPSSPSTDSGRQP